MAKRKVIYCADGIIFKSKDRKERQRGVVRKNESISKV